MLAFDGLSGEVSPRVFGCRNFIGAGADLGGHFDPVGSVAAFSADGSEEWVAEQILERLCYEAERNSTGPIWNVSVPSPYSVDLVSAGGSDFRITTYVTDVIDAASSFTAGRRLRQLRSVVEWSDAPQGKAGKGRLRISATRLIHEP